MTKTDERLNKIDELNSALKSLYRHRDFCEMSIKDMKECLVDTNVTIIKVREELKKLREEIKEEELWNK